jgi:hypothetical protein
MLLGRLYVQKYIVLNHLNLIFLKSNLVYKNESITLCE